MLIREEKLQVLTIDPGRYLGWAAWYDRDLVACGLRRSKAKHAGAIGLEQSADEIPTGADLAIVEQMIHYPAKRSDRESEASRNAKANDLIMVTAIGAIVAARSGASRIEYLPALKWKGTRPTEGVIEGMVQKALRPDELEVYAKAYRELPKAQRHNLVDAVGIGLHVHGRIR